MLRRHTLRTCPTCSRAMVHLSLHVCPEQPSIVAWLTQALPHPTRLGYIVPQYVYDIMPDKPLDASALKRVYGSWAGVAQRYGLQCPVARGGKAPGAATGGVAGLDDVSRAELYRLADMLHDGEFGPSNNEYVMYAENVPLTAWGLEKRFGTWGGVLAAAGLRHGTRSEYINAAHARRKAHQAQNARGTLDRGDEPISREYVGIPVMPTPRQLPSGGVAWTVR